VLASAISVFLLVGAGRPLFYWGATPAVVIAQVQKGQGLEAQVEEVAVVADQGGLVFRLAFDRPVSDVLHLPNGAPVSGRLRAALYLDADDDRKTGLAQGPLDLRTGADYQIEIGVLALGADEEEKRPAQALIIATLFSLTGARRKTVWRADDTTEPTVVSAYHEWLDVRLPAGAVALEPGARVILASSGHSWDGRYQP